jgi:purine-binding chemotaxis protein CheW
MKKAKPQGREGPIDWTAVRRRLERTAAAADARQLSPDQAQALLAQRARDLARVPAQAPAASEVLEIVIFALGAERYAVETRFIREVVPLPMCTPVPGAPDFLLGIINLRGEILAVMDLRHFLGLGRSDPTDHCRVLVFGGDRAEFGVLADTAHEVTSLRTGDVHETPASLAGAGREFVKGVTSDALIVLDGAVILNDRRLYIDQGDEPHA